MVVSAAALRRAAALGLRRVRAAAAPRAAPCGAAAARPRLGPRPSPPVRGRKASTSAAALAGGGGPDSAGDLEDPAAGRSVVYAAFAVYRSRAALTAKPIPPALAPVPTEWGGESFRVARRGALLLEFAEAMQDDDDDVQPSCEPSPSGGPRQYDWGAKETFGLSPAELGALVELPAGEDARFVHDPRLGQEGAGERIKTLTATPLARAGEGETDGEGPRRLRPSRPRRTPRPASPDGPPRDAPLPRRGPRGLAPGHPPVRRPQPGRLGCPSRPLLLPHPAAPGL